MYFSRKIGDWTNLDSVTYQMHDLDKLVDISESQFSQPYNGKDMYLLVLLKGLEVMLYQSARYIAVTQ